MVLSDFLSIQNHNDSNPHEIIPISFHMYKLLHEEILQYRIQRKLFGTDTI